MLLDTHEPATRTYLSLIYPVRQKPILLRSRQTDLHERPVRAVLRLLHSIEPVQLRQQAPSANGISKVIRTCCSLKKCSMSSCSSQRFSPVLAETQMPSRS